MRRYWFGGCFVYRKVFLLHGGNHMQENALSEALEGEAEYELYIHS